MIPEDKQMSDRGINDPVHGWNKVPKEIYSVVDTPLFQRLGYVSQLTLSNKVFPGANNTRKEHCLGVMNLANMYSDHLKFNDYTKKCMSIGGLLHDIAHGPYSHSWDRSVYRYIYPEVEKGHDEHRKVILEQKYDPILTNIGIDVADVLDCLEESYLHRAILQGPMGADRMDFVYRDTFYTNTRHYGYYDIHRIIENSSIIQTSNGEKLCYNEKIYPDIIQALETRNKMYENIYYHKTSVGLQILLEEAINDTKKELKFIDRTNDLDKFEYLTDAVLFEMIPLNESARNVYLRKYPKMIDQEILISSLVSGESTQENTYHTWTSPQLTNNFEKEFTKHDIYINTKKQGPISFSEYWRNQKESINAMTWNIRRVYSLG